jgi:hypothetical protein
MRLLLLPAAGGPLAADAAPLAAAAGGRGRRLAFGGRRGGPGAGQRARGGPGCLLGLGSCATYSSDDSSSVDGSVLPEKS